MNRNAVNRIVGAVLASLVFGSASVAWAAALTTGNLIVSGTPATVKEITPTGTLVQTLPNAGPGSSTTGMCFDAAGGLLVTLFDNGTIAQYNTTGGLVTSAFITAPGSPEACVRDSSGNFYVTSVTGVAAIRKYSSTGALLQSYLPGARSDWLDLAADNCTMYYDNEGASPTIKRFNVCTGTALADLGGNGQYTALRVSPGSGDIIVANGATNTVQRFSSAGTLLGAWTPTGRTGTVFSLNLDPDGLTFWTGDTGGSVFRFALSGFGTQIIKISSGNNPLYGVAVVGEITVATGGLSINSVSINEGNSGTTPFVFTVTLSPASASTVTVNYAIADGTATAGTDYVATSGTLTFNPGQTTQQITVNVTGDTSVEANETFFVNLSAATNATINNGQGTGTILNDDVAPTIPANIPTLSDWALAAIALLLAASAMLGMRRRR